MGVCLEGREDYSLTWLFMEKAEDSSCERRNVTIRKTFNVYYKYPGFQIPAFFFALLNVHGVVLGGVSSITPLMNV